MKGDTLAGIIIGAIVGAIIVYAYMSSTSIQPTGNSIYPPCPVCPTYQHQVNYRQASYKLDQNIFTGSGTWLIGGANLNVQTTNTDNTGAVFQITLACRRLEGNDVLTSPKVYIDAGSTQTIQINYPSSELSAGTNYNCTISNVDAPIVNGCS
jgi:hypothetical protein